MGPIDHLAVEWPERHVTGEGFRLLMDLVVEHSDALDERLWGLSSGLLDQSDIDRTTARLVGAGRIVADDLIAALDASDPA